MKPTYIDQHWHDTSEYAAPGRSLLLVPKETWPDDVDDEAKIFPTPYLKLFCFTLETLFNMSSFIIIISKIEFYVGCETWSPCSSAQCRSRAFP